MKSRYELPGKAKQAASPFKGHSVNKRPTRIILLSLSMYLEMGDDMQFSHIGNEIEEVMVECFFKFC